jgi:hypothetical protein
MEMQSCPTTTPSTATTSQNIHPPALQPHISLKVMERTPETSRETILSEWQQFLNRLKELEVIDAPAIKRLLDGTQLAKALGVKPGKDDARDLAESILRVIAPISLALIHEEDDDDDDDGSGRVARGWPAVYEYRHTY